MGNPRSMWLPTPDGMQRADGLCVQRSLDGWIVLPADDREALDCCPCCGTRLASEQAAVAVANVYLPPL